MTNENASLVAVKLSRKDKRLLTELVAFISHPDDEQPLTMSGVVRIAIRKLHENMARRIGREARTA